MLQEAALELEFAIFHCTDSVQFVESRQPVRMLPFSRKYHFFPQESFPAYCCETIIFPTLDGENVKFRAAAASDATLWPTTPLL